MVCHELEAEAIPVDVLMEAFARPDESECFFLGLAVPAFDVGERSAGVADWLRDAVVLLDDHCSESNRAGACDDLGALGVAVEVSQGSYFREFPFECVEGVLLLRSPDEVSAFVRQAAERLGGCRETRDEARAESYRPQEASDLGGVRWARCVRDCLHFACRWFHSSVAEAESEEFDLRLPE